MAIPHAYLDGVEQQIVQFVRLAHPLNMGAPDGIPTQFLFFLLGPPNAAAQHLDTLANVARVMSDDEFRYEVGEARSTDDLLAALNHFTERTSPEPTAREKPSDGLAYTGQLGGGLRQYVARRWPHYLSDFRDGLHAKCVGSTLFLFFACLAPAVTFGGVMAVQTDDQIGAVEMIAASAFCGVMFALLSGQPLIILGGTGPLLVFTAILYRLCSDLSIPFLPSYGWVGLWSAGFLLILAVTDASCLTRYFTRFTDEIFSALISLIFIYEAVKALVHIVEDLDVRATTTRVFRLNQRFVLLYQSRYRNTQVRLALRKKGLRRSPPVRLDNSEPTTLFCFILMIPASFVWSQQIESSKGKRHAD